MLVDDKTIKSAEPLELVRYELELGALSQNFLLHTYHRLEMCSCKKPVTG